MTHTPGPWFVHDLSGVDGPVSVSCTTPDHITVADIGPGLTNTKEEALSNAYLIASTPKMLTDNHRLRRALLRLTDYMEGQRAFDTDDFEEVDTARDVLRETEEYGY